MYISSNCLDRQTIHLSSPTMGDASATTSAEAVVLGADVIDFRTVSFPGHSIFDVCLDKRILMSNRPSNQSAQRTIVYWA